MLLSDEQIGFYRENGYIAVENVFSETEMEEMRRVTDEFVEKSRLVATHTDVFDLEPGHTPETPRLRRLKNPADQHPAYDRALRHPNVLDIVGQLVGPAIRYNGHKLNMKSPDYGSPVEWHQDWAFYPHTNDDLLAVGIAMDDSTLENGCLLVLPGTHKGPVFDHHQDGHFVGAITDPEFDPAGAVPILVKAGGISIHHVRTVHGSARNTSKVPRRLLLFQYCAADAWPLVKECDWDEWNRYLLRGEPVNRPRLADVPVQLPLPPPLHEGSIYEIQTDLAKSAFS